MIDEQKKQIEEHHAAAAFRRHRKPPVMAEPEQAGDDEADRQRDDRLRIDANQVHPVRRLGEAAGLRQIIGEQRHGNAEDGVAQHLQPAHFEKTGLRQCAPPPHQSVFAFAALKLRRTRSDLRSSRGCATRSPSGLACQAVARGHKPAFACRLRRGSLHSLRERRLVRAVGTRTHTTLPSRDFKSLASTSSATSA